MRSFGNAREVRLRSLKLQGGRNYESDQIQHF